MYTNSLDVLNFYQLSILQKNMREKNDIETNLWSMSLQYIGGSFLLCLPKSWVRKNLKAGKNILLVEDIGNKTLKISPIEKPQYENYPKN